MKWQKAIFPKFPEDPPIWVKTGKPVVRRLPLFNEYTRTWNFDDIREVPFFESNVKRPPTATPPGYFYVAQSAVELLPEFSDEVPDDLRFCEEVR